MSMSSRIILPTIKPNAFLSTHTHTACTIALAVISTIYTDYTASTRDHTAACWTKTINIQTPCEHEMRTRPTNQPSKTLYVLYDSFRDKRPFKIDKYSPPCWIPDGKLFAIYTQIQNAYIAASKKITRSWAPRKIRFCQNNEKYFSCSASNSCCKRLIRHTHCAWKRLACVWLYKMLVGTNAG